MKALNAHQAARLLRWLEDLGYEEAWDMTAAELAYRLNVEDGQDCYTRSHMERRRAEVWPRRHTKPDRISELERLNRELSRRVTALELELKKMRQGSVFTAA